MTDEEVRDELENAIETANGAEEIQNAINGPWIRVSLCRASNNHAMDDAFRVHKVQTWGNSGSFYMIYRFLTRRKDPRVIYIIIRLNFPFLQL